MATMIQGVVDSYNDLFINRRDPRVDGWLLMDSPFPTLFICLSYVYIVKVLGPWYMKDRPPLSFRNLLVAYNAFQVVFSAWVFYELGMGGWFVGYSFWCQPVDYSDDPTSVRMVHASWWYYFSKFTEFFDTFFFVLRKKFDHVSALHVVHHGCMPMSVWLGVKFTPGGHSTFFGLINSLVHIVMYFYYMVAAMGPQYQRWLWWKKYLTNLQMIQFVMIFTHAFQLCFIECQYPRAFMWWIGGHAVMFFLLFSDFYKKAYLRRSADRKKLKFSSYMPCFIHHEEASESKKGKSNGHVVNGITKMASGVRNGYLKDVPNGHITRISDDSGTVSNGHISNGGSIIANGHIHCTEPVNSNVHSHLESSNGHLPTAPDSPTQKARERRFRKE